MVTAARPPARTPRPIKPLNMPDLIERRRGKLPPAPGQRQWEHRPSKAFELGCALEVGDLVYTPPERERYKRAVRAPDTAEGDEDLEPELDRPRYDALRGEAPGFAELTNTLARRGMTLRLESPFWWRAVST